MHCNTEQESACPHGAPGFKCVHGPLSVDARVSLDNHIDSFACFRTLKCCIFDSYPDYFLLDTFLDSLSNDKRLNPSQRTLNQLLFCLIESAILLLQGCNVLVVLACAVKMLLN